MRPEILFDLFAATTSIRGVGANTGKLLEKLSGTRVRDILFHMPVGMLQRYFVERLGQAAVGQTITIILTVEQHFPPPSQHRKRPYKVRARDGQGMAVDLIFFSARQDYLLKILPVGATRMVSGTLDAFNHTWQITHPDHIGSPEEVKDWTGIEAVYPLTQGITTKYLNKVMKEALQRCPELPEWLDEDFRLQMQWPHWREAIYRAHQLEKPEMLSPLSPARRRLAYDELLANQLGLLLIRQHFLRQKGRSLKGDGHLRRKLLEALPFALTQAQQRAVQDINQDMGAESRMVRLLQGDVGSGKTVVAMMAMLNAVECGFQAAMLAPTEILAQQHYETLKTWAESVGVRVALLVQRSKGKKQILAALEEGMIDIVVGTHAILQEHVTFKNLGLAVIDEQHRFGVEQRLKLGQKGENVDSLVMTATPIPRTLMLATYGDLATSILDEKPPGRQEIVTKVLPTSKLDSIIEGLQRAIAEGQKVYWVCPLIEESEVLDLAAAQDRYEALKKVFHERVALIHGRMKGDEKDQTMNDFLSGKYQLLVATTVIEVGVHVEDATIMVIEHAERFGLAQLHQLRGRIGRGRMASTCVLIYDPPLSENATRRLKIMKETTDGFRIAEEDFRLRGGGDVLGLRQSGLPDFKLVDPELHQDLLPLAHRQAQDLLSTDPALTTPRGKAAKVLLYLFDKDKAIHYLSSG